MSTLEKLLAALAASGALVMGYGVWQTHQQAIGESRATVWFSAAIEDQKRAAAAQLAIETARAGAATQALQDFKNDQERKDAENQSAVADLAARLRVAAGAGGRLRDPNTAQCRGGSSGAPAADPGRAGAGAADGATDSGLLSKQLTEFLLSQAADADQVNLAYASCRADAVSLRQVLP